SVSAGRGPAVDHVQADATAGCREDLQNGVAPILSVRNDELWPPDHRLVNPGLTVDLGERCTGRAVVSLRVFSDEPDNGTGDGDTPIDAQIAPPDLLLREERSGTGDGRVYLVEATASYAGATSARCTTVVVPKSQTRKDRDGAQAQAQAARAHCGTMPPGFHEATEGVLIGA